MRDGNELRIRDEQNKRIALESNYEGWKLIPGYWAGTGKRALESNYEGWKLKLCIRKAYKYRIFRV